MEKRKGTKGCIVVLPGEIIEIPQASNKSCWELYFGKGVGCVCSLQKTLETLD